MQRAMWLESELARRAIRVGLGSDNTISDVDAFISALADLGAAAAFRAVGCTDGTVQGNRIFGELRHEKADLF